MTTRDPEFDAIDAKSIFLEAKDRLHIAITAETDNRNDAKYAMNFREGNNHWDEAPTATTASMDEPELTINLTDTFVTRVENNIREQRPRGKCHPVGDGADIDIAEVINGIGRHVETRSEAGVAYDLAAKCALTAGWGYFRLIAEYVGAKSFHKDLRILPIRNIFTVYMDPSAIMPSGCDQAWCLISIKQKLAEYRRKNPSAEAVNWGDLAKDSDEWHNKEEIRLAEYFRIREKEERLFLLRGPDGSEFTRYKSEMPSDESIAASGLKIEGDRSSTKRQVEWFLLNGTEVRQREQLPGTWIPVFRVEGNVTDIDGDVKRRGMVKGMQDAQRMVDYGEVSKIKRLGLAPKAPWVAAEGQLTGHPEWDNANTQSYSVLTYKPITISTAQGDVLLPPPQRQPPAQLEAGFAEFTNGMRSNLLALAGMPNEPGQDTTGQVVSGRALRRRDKLSDQAHYQYYDNLTLAIAQLWRVMVEWIPHYFPEKGRIQRIIGEDSTPQMVTLNAPEETEGVKRIKNDLSVGRYDVVMDTGPGYETKREEGSETLLGMLQAQVIAETLMKIAPDLIFRSIDHPYMQEIADRFSAMTPDGLKQVMAELPSRAKAIVQALANENAQLKQTLQAAQAGITKAHIAATVKAHDTETRARQAELDTHVRAHTELAREEIAGGVDLTIKAMEHGHDERMAEREAQRMLETGSEAEKPNGGAK